MEKTYIDPIFHMEKDERLYDMSLYLDIDHLDRISELNNLNGVDGMYNKKESLFILERYLPTELEWVKEVKSPYLIIDELDMKLGMLYELSHTRLLVDFELDEFAKLISFFCKVNIESIIIDSRKNAMYIPYEEVMDLFNRHTNFSFLKAEMMGHEMLCAHSMCLVPVELVIMANKEEYHSKFNQIDFITKTKTYLEEYSYVFMKKTPNELYKTLKLKMDKKKRKTYLMIDSSNGLIKIGYSKNPYKREKTLQSEKPTISLMALYDGDIEKELHEHFKDKRVRGEWFKLNTDDLFYLGEKWSEKR